MLQSSYESVPEQLRMFSGAVMKVFRSSCEIVPGQLVSVPEQLISVLEQLVSVPE